MNACICAYVYVVAQPWQLQLELKRCHPFPARLLGRQLKQHDDERDIYIYYINIH